VAELEARKQRLQAKQEIVEETFEKTLNKLHTLSIEQYQNIVIDMIVQTVNGGNVEIIVSDSDKQRLSPDFIDIINRHLKSKGINANVTLSEESRGIDSGFILKMGDVEINNSFDAIIRMQRDELESEVIKILF
jgi:V/A-type H+-transporting ATPase subunit E